MAIYTLRWGILATGAIAETFARDLWVDPQTRGVRDIKHKVVAAASSSSLEKAQRFLNDVRAPEGKAYGSYEELVNDSSVDIIYVATPHSHHYQNVRMCLEAGKPVLCEKAFTVNAAQLRKLTEIARARDLFLMEAIWVRYLPISRYVRDTRRRLGKLLRTTADLSHGHVHDFPDDSRLVNLDLAGGVLLDIGIYSLTWVFQTLYNGKTPRVQSIALKGSTGADESVNILLDFDGVIGIATAGLKACTDPDGRGSAGPAIRVQGSLGEVVVYAPAFRPVRTRLVLKDGTIEDKEWHHPGAGGDWTNGFDGVQPGGEAQGMYWEADECAYALRDGRKEGMCGLDESIAVMEVMDRVRQQNDLVYPERIASLEYPIRL